MHYRGLGVARDDVRAVELLDGACRSGAPGACDRLERLRDLLEAGR